jgi:hypothetical protein
MLTPRLGADMERKYPNVLSPFMVFLTSASRKKNDVRDKAGVGSNPAIPTNT